MFDSNAGQERSGISVYWPPRELTLGAGVCGKIAGRGSYTVKGDDGTSQLVPTVKLVECVTYTPTDDGGRLRQEISVEVSLNADLRRKLDADVLAVGTPVQVVFTGEDAEYNNMRRYRVSTVTASYHARLVAGSSSDPAHGMA